ncbi:MAG: phage Gp37/Gp68 family protein [Pseudomonadota bacterium]|nr:phage Gp37/Gp68 family protein [Pseudomonadota bacterium]
MSDKTGIQWTEATWNPATGCTKVSQGCKNCYAKYKAWPRLAAMKNNVYSGREFEDVQVHPGRLDQPLRWTKPRRIFVNSMSDLFHESIPFQFIADVFAVMSCTTRHTYQVLTKRPQRMLEFFNWLTYEDPWSDWPNQVNALNVWPQWKPHHGHGGYDNCGPNWPLENVWLGVSVEDQQTADERIPLLLKTPAVVHWVSAEPLLGPIKFGTYTLLTSHCFVCAIEDKLGQERGTQSHPINCIHRTKSKDTTDVGEGISWVVVGGESGHNARPTHPDWVRLIRDQCIASRVPFFFKQWGEWAPKNSGTGVMIDRVPDLEKFISLDPSTLVYRTGKKSAGRSLDGREWNEYPSKD